MVKIYFNLILEHFKIWCTGLDRYDGYEDVAYKEDYTAILKYCQ